MPDYIQLDDLMAQILAELKSLNRTARLLVSHLMESAEAPPAQSTGRQTLPVMSNELPQGLPEADELPQKLPPRLERGIREMALERREQLLGDLEKAWKGN